MAIANALNASQAGLQALDSSGAWAGRTLTAGTGISISDGDGVSGNPTISASGSSGQLVLLQTQTASNSTFLNFVTNTNIYTNHMFVFNNVQGATNSANIYIQVSNVGGAPFTTTGYTSGCYSWIYDGTGVLSTVDTIGFILATALGNASANNTFNGVAYINNCNTANFCYINGVFAYDEFIAISDHIRGNICMGQSPITGVNAFKVVMNTGNIKQGTISLFGIKPT